MLPSYTNQDSYISYKKLVNLLRSNFEYDLSKQLLGLSTIDDVLALKESIHEQQMLISEGSYEYTNPKYRKNIIVLEALGHLINLMEIRTYRLEPKSGALVNFVTAADKLKSLLNPKDNRPDLSYFTADHLNIEEPIKVVGPDANDVEASVTNAANQTAPEDNLKKAEVYVGVNDGDPNYTTPTNDALEKELAGMTSGDLLNLTDKVKLEVKKDLAKEISDAALLAKRRGAALKMNESVDISNLGLGDKISHKTLGKGSIVKCTEKPSVTVKFENGQVKTFSKKEEEHLGESTMSKEEVEDLLAAVRKNIAEQGRIVDDRLLEKERKLFALLKTYKDDEINEGESKMSGKIIKKLLESEIEKAEIVLGVKSITDDLQNMAEKISKMQIEDIAALTERLKAEFGVETGDQFQAEVGQFLGTALTAIQSSKSSIDNKALALSGDVEGGMAKSAAPIGTSLAAPDEASDELPGGTEGEDMFGGHESNSGDEEEPLGRVKKESKLFSGKTLFEAKKETAEKLKKKLEKMEDSFGGFDPSPAQLKKHKELKAKIKSLKESVTVLCEKWDTEAKTNPKKKGMFDGKNASELKAEVARLRKKKNHTPAETTKMRELNYAIRAKTGWGKTNESDMESGKEVLMDEGASRKHFRMVADTLKNVEDKKKRKELAQSHADAFKKMNPRFSHQKFYSACGLDECDNSNGMMSPMSTSTKNFESVEPRKMGNPEHMAKKEVNPKTPKNTAKLLDAKAVNVKKK